MLGEHAYTTYLSALKEDLADISRRTGTKGDNTSFPASLNTSVEYFPLHTCGLDSGSFVLPAASSAAVSARIGAHPAGLAPPDALPGDDGLDAPEATGLKLVAHSLLGFASELGVRLDTFSLGPVSNLIGDEICAMAGSAAASETAALVLVDRCLDLVTPLSHTDHVLDQIYGTLQRRLAAGNPAVRSSDVVVPLPHFIGGGKQLGEREAPSTHGEPRSISGNAEAQEPHRQTSTGAVSTSGVALQGSLYAPSDAQMGQWREFLVTRQGKDAALFLRKWLREALRKAGIQTMMRFKAGSVPAEEFRALSELLAAAPPKVCFGHLGIMQLGCAAAAALSGPRADRWARLAELEQELIHLSANCMDEEVAEKLCVAISEAAGESSDAGISATDALGLCVVALALASNGGDLCLSIRQVEAGDSEADEEARYEAQALRLELTDKVMDLLMKLQKTAAARSRLKDMQRYLEHGAGSKGVTPLLSQLTSRILDQRPIPDMQHNSASLGGLLKSGLGRFGLVQKQPQPGDHSTVIIFVVGGISVADLREVRHVVAEKVTGQPGRASVKVLVGGTALMSPHDVVDGLLN
ncbi:hypothetical protein COCSUDRAFT_42345 [Coccomyxa subellipsoidea C-169]|uniref:Sec1-like protein n=1 Tax=Coccomyxa subellipsoidea (strain C-169) TaxID=574566 RepID=I0YWE1_COCSC|nr:hypothetical protein COCSUDRAFT_42345 [Coccomyxa subellipsoidea C-169]EIE22710.1 hypothetical protein COCSUDRAFT_42345 [Coccomyxa subellipsoidea C-169]|eukprot:XP_005647254.1 hypothetical protein COCSUDRAFT_42345 [Coccomyxa subellipsoidea C-169]